jgi:hypothetical protein
MSAGCPIPNNINPLSPTGFRLSIAKLPSVSYFAQEVTLPEVSLPSVSVNTPLSTLSYSGDLMTFGDFTINFLVDEDMENYNAIFNWINGLGFPESHDQFADLVSTSQADSNYNVRGAGSTYSDGVLEILGANNVPVRSLKFVDLTPIALGSLTFVSNATDVNYLIGTVSFRYTLFKFE